MSDLLKMVAEWRKQWGHEGDGGVVIVFKDQVEGWCNELRSPTSWVPGCIAIDEAGNKWVAAGGDDYNGATEWVSLADITWESIRYCLVRFHEHYKGFEFRGLTDNGLPLVAHHYDDDGRTRVTTDWIELDRVQPYAVTVAGFPVEVH